MTNTLALILGALILIAIGIDTMLYGSEHVIFLGQRLFWLLDWLAFWR